MPHVAYAIAPAPGAAGDDYVLAGPSWVVLLDGATPPTGAQTPTTKAEQLGDVHFPVSCAGEAPNKFHRAMALYHSFDWKGGNAAFDEITRLAQEASNIVKQFRK